jgi:transposase-like protein
LIAIAVEIIDGKHPGRTCIAIIPDASGQSLENFVEGNIEKGSTVVTDGWASYSFLGKSGFGHIQITKAEIKNDEKLLPHVHLIVSLLKRWLLGTHQGAVSEKHLQAYLDEYVFRFNRRKSAERGLLFYRLVECAMVVKPVTYDELVSKGFF